MEQVYSEQTMRDYLRVIFRQKSVIITCFITVMLTVLIGLQFKTDVYESSVKMLISAEKSIDSLYYRDISTGYKSEVTLTQSEIVTANPVIERAVRAIGLYQRPLNYEASFSTMLKKPFIKLYTKSITRKLAKLSEIQAQGALFRFAVDDLRQHVKVEPIRDTNLFTITIRDYSPIGAAVLANVVSRSYVIFDLEQQLADLQLKYGEKHLSVTQLRDNIEKMTKNLTGQPISDIEAIGPATVKIIEQATVPLLPTGPSKYLIAILAFFMSIFLGVMLAFMFEYMDQTFKTPSDIETYLNLPFLGSIPKNARATSFRIVSDQIFLLMKDKKLKSLLLTSVMEQEGVTHTIKNIAFELSVVEGLRVLVIDANFRNSSMHKVFKITGDKGLADVLEDKATIDQVIQHQNKNLAVLSAGKTNLNPATLLSSNRMADLVKNSKEKFDIVLIDCSPLSNFRDVVFLSSAIDGLVLVVNEGRTRRQAVKVAVDQLVEKKINILGAILNNRSYVIPKAIYDRF